MTKLAHWMREHQKRDQDVAQVIGRDRSIVSRIRRGELTPTLSVAVAIERMTAGEIAVQSWIEDAAA